MKHGTEIRATRGRGVGRILFFIGVSGLFWALAQPVCEAHPLDFSVQLTATVQESPARIGVQWQTSASATHYIVMRKRTTDVSMTTMATITNLPVSATGWVDSNVVVGVTYEYQVYRYSAGGTASGYMMAVIQRPLVDNRGKFILVVDETQSAALTNEIVRLQKDLAGDGWTVLRHDVARKNWNEAGWKDAVTATKALIAADYNADTNNVKAVLLLGHVPIPYSGSGSFYPDGHTDHAGAWPADVYYGDVDGNWTDSSTTWTNNGDRQDNIPGDGKFDQNYVPYDASYRNNKPELQVGRVDFFDMPCFSKNETELLRQYLDKDHNYRIKAVTTQPRGLVDDNFGDIYGEEFAANGWRNFGHMFGPTNVFEVDWFSTLSTGSYQWAYGCGGGNYQGASGVGSCWDFASVDTKVNFTMLFGSYFGDWDVQNAFMRSALGTPTYTLSCSWGARPDNTYYVFMTTGETIGECMRRIQPGQRIHLTLLGDPSLRLHMMTPASGLSGSKSGGQTTLSWTASPESGLLGYHVYRGASALGPFTRLTTSLVTGANYTDTAAPGGDLIYMVRPVKLEVSNGGSYSNIGQGVFATIGDTLNHAPAANAQSLTVGEDSAGLAIALTGSDADLDPLTYYISTQPLHGTITGIVPNVVYKPTANYFGVDSFGFQVNDGKVDSSIGIVTLTITNINDAPAVQNQTISVAQEAANVLGLSVTDLDHDVLALVVESGPAHGAVTGVPPSVVYTPTPGYSGADSFTYHVNDGTVNSGSATVTLNVLPMRDPENPPYCVYGVNYEEYSGSSWGGSLPNFDSLTASKTGTVSSFSLSMRTSNDNFAVRYRGYLKVPVSGAYTFYTISDDGSKLYLGADEVVNNDGYHGDQEASGVRALKAGKHAITVTFFEATGGETLYVSWAGPGLTREIIPAGVLYREDSTTVTTNGTPCWWLDAYLPPATNYAGQAVMDSDGDGLLNWEEYRAGTDPSSGSSVFALLGLQSAGANNQLSWYGTTNSGVMTDFVVDMRTNLLLSTWSRVASNLVRSGSGVNVWVHTNAPAPPVFYRIVIP